MVTDSGGIQEEAPTLGRTVLLFRTRTERPEAVAGGIVKVIGASADELLHALQNSLQTPEFLRKSHPVRNPFGRGSSARAIVDILEALQGGLSEPLDAAVL